MCNRLIRKVLQFSNKMFSKSQEKNNFAKYLNYFPFFDLFNFILKSINCRSKVFINIKHEIYVYLLFFFLYKSDVLGNKCVKFVEK